MALLKRILYRAEPYRSLCTKVRIKWAPYWEGGCGYYVCCDEHFVVSPVFPSLDDLIDWMIDVFQLPSGTKNLLKIEALR